MRPTSLLAFLGAAVALSACATDPAATSIVGGYPYTGSLVRMPLAEVHVRTEDGQDRKLTEVLPGIDLHARTYARLPFDRAPLNRIGADRELLAFVQPYDANANGWMEEPEMVVLYVREGARGLGQPVAHVGREPPIGALWPRPGEVAALVSYVKSRYGTMDKDSAWMFTKLEWFGRDYTLEADGTDSRIEAR